MCVFNTYAWTTINGRHTRGWVDHVWLPPIHRPCHQVAKHGVNISLRTTKWFQPPYFLLSLQLSFVQLKSHACGKTLSSWAPHNADQKNDSHPLRFYWVFVSVAAVHSLDKKRQGKSITVWVFVCFCWSDGYSNIAEQSPALIAYWMYPQGSFPSFCHMQQQGDSNSSMHY